MIRIFRPFALGLCLSAALLGQSYQSSFSEVKYDRARTPATFHGGAEVDLPSGALTYNVPLGPGIGARGVKYVPTLSTRWAPQTPPIQPYSGSNQVHPGGISCVLTPGYFVVSVVPPGDSGGAVIDSEYLLPDGSAGSGGSMSAPGPYPSGIAPMTILQDFGITGVTSAALRVIGSRGELVFELVGDAYPSTRLYSWRPTKLYPNPPFGSPMETFTAPGGIAVVSPDGATVTVFVYVNPQYKIEFGESPSPTSGFAPAQLAAGDSVQNYLLAVHYLPSLIRNRFGDQIRFDHLLAGPTWGVDFKATWSRGGSDLGSVSVTKVSGPTMPSVFGINGGGSTISGARMRVSYSETHLSTYSVDAYAYGLWTVDQPSSWGKALSSPWDRFRRNMQPSLVTVDATGETVKFDYQDAVTDSTTGMFTPVTLKSLTMPGRKITFSWNPYKYRRPTGWTFATYGVLPAGFSDLYTATGVVKVDDKDLTTGGQTRTTTYTRVVPIPDPNHESGPYWTSTTFKVGVSHPDGNGTLTRYAEPLQGFIYDPYASPSASQVFQVLANLKHLPTEVREYAKGVSWAGDNGVGGPGFAFRVALYGPPATSGRFAVSGYDNPYWSLKRVGNPSGVLESGGILYPLRTETWAPEVHRVETRDNWDATNYGWKTKTLQADCTGSSKTLVSTFTYDSKPTHWLMSRVTSESHPDQPVVSREFHTTNNTLSWVSVGGSAGVKTGFTYLGLPQPETVTLSSTAFALSDQVGATYTFDSYGFVNSITPKGMNWGYQQTQDSLGRPTNQTNPQGIKVDFGYTTAGRLEKIQPPNGESATVISYDPDNLGATITRNKQWSHLRYNGFGELVSETRAIPSGTAVRTFSYDLAGRKSFESIWGNSTVGTNWTYDVQGRLSTLTDPNGLASLTTYSGPSWAVQVGGAAGPKTTFTKDALGRLVKVVDALSQTTDYSYDDAGRVRTATQSGTQIRRWNYTTPMRWLDNIVQPESGKTSYSGYTVAGKPTVTVYGDGSATPRTVTATPDTLGRVTRLTSAGATLQAFNFIKDKLDYAYDQKVRLNYGYGGLNGRLSALTTTVWNTGPAAATGAGDFSSVQGFEYNADGLRKSATVDGRKQTLAYFDELGVPNQLNYTGAGLNLALLGAATATNASGQPTDFTYANSSSSHLDYRPDGTGLAGLRHSFPGTTSPRIWTYTYPTSGRLAGQMTSDGEDNYDYDLLGRLTSATVKVPAVPVPLTVTQTYEYDPFGNPLASSTANLGLLPSGIQKNFADFRFNAVDFAATNRVPARTVGGQNPGDTGAVYDSQGNLVQIFKQVSEAGKSLNLQYDPLGRVTLMHDSETGLWEFYFYTPEGLRTRIETYQGTAVENLVLQKVQHRIYNDQRQLVSEYEAVRQ